MKRWQYKIVDSKDVPSDGIFKGRSRVRVEEHLNQLGGEGWELINLDFRELEGRFEFSGVARKEVTV